jgi:5'-nucleotidase (lipoprotein e(P4) family)
LKRLERPHRASLLLVGALLGACAAHEKPKTPATPAPAAGTPPATRPAPESSPLAAATGRLGDGVHWFRAAAEYRAIALSTYRAATEAVTAAARGRARDSWAVVLDADETVLDNSVFQRDLGKNGSRFTEDLWADFVRLRSAPPVPGARSFLEHVKQLGGRVAIVTNRFDHLCEDTRENFRRERLPFDAILCRTGASDKNPRFESAATGAAFGDAKPREVLAYVGDNIHDFPKLNQSLRDEPEANYADFGRRFFVLPNPMYGSWQQVPGR